jgi:hypothetical protein
VFSLGHLAFLIASGLSALCAFAAAWYWYLSSRPSPDITPPPEVSVDDAPALHILDAQVNTYRIQAASIEASRFNKKAAIWSAGAALWGGIAALLSAL